MESAEEDFDSDGDHNMPLAGGKKKKWESDSDPKPYESFGPSTLSPDISGNVTLILERDNLILAVQNIIKVLRHWGRTLCA